MQGRSEEGSSRARAANFAFKCKLLKTLKKKTKRIGFEKKQDRKKIGFEMVENELSKVSQA